MRHLRDVALGTGAVAIDYLAAQARTGKVRSDLLQARTGKVRSDLLQALGDQCLLLAGWYPEQARRRRVSLDYFVRLGQGAYQGLLESQPTAVELAPHFVAMMDALIWIRQRREPVLSLLELTELATRTRSQLAADLVQAHGVLVRTGTAH